MLNNKNRWHISLTDLKLIIIGSVFYALLSWLTGYMRLESVLGMDLRPAIVIPILYGLIYGPLVGLFTGLLGNLVGDALNYNMIYVYGILGNGVMGLVPGLFAREKTFFKNFKHIMYAIVVSLLGILCGMAALTGYAVIFKQPLPVTEIILSDPKEIFSFYIQLVLVNLISIIIILPLILYNLANLDLKSRDWTRSGLVKKLLGTIVIASVIPIALLGFFLTQEFIRQESSTSAILIKIFATIIITLLFTVTSSILLAQKISGPLLKLTKAAKSMKKGEFKKDDAEKLLNMEGNDEVIQLGNVFSKMAQEVIAREEKLRSQVEELKIKIDEVNKRVQVSEITESEYFKELKIKAKLMRDKRNSNK
ncbi:MAG: ECF transporter S component [Candidatus Tenebribacter burtonii]|jgi:energy-coupling factor transport system substrate-specific component|nr:ECF transporter S component [Candidatus Tenebribacter burtonii]